MHVQILQPQTATQQGRIHRLRTSKPQSQSHTRRLTALVIITIMLCAFYMYIRKPWMNSRKIEEKSHFQAPKKIFKDIEAVANQTLKMKHFQGLQGGMRTLICLPCTDNLHTMNEYLLWIGLFKHSVKLAVYDYFSIHFSLLDNCIMD